MVNGLSELSAVVERVKRFSFLGLYINDDLKWSLHTDSVVKKMKLRLFNLRRLKKFVLTLTNFYRCTIESFLLGCIATWYGKTTGLSRGWNTPNPPGYLQHPVSHEGQEDHEGPQPPEPRPVHPPTI